MVTIVTNLQAARSESPAVLALFTKRALLILGELAEGSSCPFFLAGRIGREFSDQVAQQLLDNCHLDAGTSRARRKTGWQI